MAHILSRITGWVVRHKKRIQTIGTGLFIYECFNLAYNWGFYIFSLSYWGIEDGAILAAGLSFIINAAIFWAYDHMKMDWLGAYALRELDAKENKSRFEQLAVWVSKENKTWWEKILTATAFVLVLIGIDPVIVAVHFQHEHFKGLKAYDWYILFMATAVANIWWLIRIGLLVEVIRFILKYLFN